MDNERRAFARITLPMNIELCNNGIVMAVLETIDISNGGAFIKAAPEHCSAIGAELTLRVKGSLGGEQPPIMHARVVRTTENGMGIVFLPDPAQHT